MTVDPASEHIRQRPRTGLAIVIALASYLSLYVVYLMGAAAMGALGAKYDKSGSWMLILVLLTLVVPALAGFGAMIAAARFYPSSNEEAVFYSFSTLLVFLLLLQLGSNRNEAAISFVQIGLSILGARIGKSYGKHSTI